MVVVVPMYEAFVGSSVAAILISPRVDGRYEQMAVKEFPALTVLFLQPGRILPATLKVTLPATVATAVMFLACLKTKLPGARVSEALTVPDEIVIVVAVELSSR